MKIQSITGYAPSSKGLFNSKSLKSNQTQRNYAQDCLSNHSYNSALIKAGMINFKGGIDNNTQLQITQTPFEKDISTAYSFAGTNDIVLIGKDFESAKTDLAGSINQYPKVISRILFIEDKNAPTTFSISSNMYNTPFVKNLGAKSFFQMVGDKEYRIAKDDTMFLREGGVFTYGKSSKSFKIETNRYATLTDLNESKIQIYDLNSYHSSSIGDINKKRLEAFGIEAKEKAKEEKQVKKVTFADVGGQDKAIKELKKSVIFPIKYPEAFSVVNHGVILQGGPGTGKSLIAEALANEVQANYVKLNGLELESKWAGESEENWRVLFQQAKETQPSVIFIDEFDAVARKREGSETSRHDDKIVNQILTLMSDIEKADDQVYVIAATNKKDILDDAIVRSGRFGKEIEVPNPDLDGCKKILEIHTRDKKVDRSVDKDALAQKLFDIDSSGADIAAVVEEAQNFCYLRHEIFEKMDNGTFQMSDLEKAKITTEDFDEAINLIQEKKDVKNNKMKIGFRS